MRDSHNISELQRAFIQKCLDSFTFLAAYGCEVIGVEEDSYGAEVTYKNETTAVKISFEVRENAVFVYLIQLIDGEVPAYLDAPSRWFYLDNVLEFKSPSSGPIQKELEDWLTPESVGYLLASYADALKNYGEDVLHGDFSVFAELTRRIDRSSSSNDGELRVIASNEELRVQKEKLPAQIVEYYRTYFHELRSTLNRPDVFSEAVPKYLKGCKRIISIGGRDGAVVAHFPIELGITVSETSKGSVLLQFPSVLDAQEDSYEFIQFPSSPVRDLITLISGGEDVEAGIPTEGVFWGVRGFNAPQQKIDSTSGELAWQAPWTRLTCADLYHLRYWEDEERARREAMDDVEPYIRDMDSQLEKVPVREILGDAETFEDFSEVDMPSGSTNEPQTDLGRAFNIRSNLLNVDFALASAS